MNANQRTLATEIAEAFHVEEDRAVTIHHRGQTTVADYLALDRVEPWEMTTPVFRVKTNAASKAFEYLGVIDGWLIRTELPNALLQCRWARKFLTLPYLRLVDDLTGFAQPEYSRTSRPCTPSRGSVANVPSRMPATHPCRRTRTRMTRHQPTEEGRPPMPAPTLIPDPDPVDRARGIDLGDAGLPGYCAAVTTGADGEEHLALLKYSAAACEYRPEDWRLVAPHELVGLPVYRKD
jgi:hypothetical protein